MTVSLAEATAAARRIQAELGFPLERDARLLADAWLAGDTERLRAALAELLAYTGEIERRLGAQMAVRSYLPPFPDGAKELGERCRALIAEGGV